MVRQRARQAGLAGVCASVAAHARERDARGGWVVARDRAGAAPPGFGDDRDLREGRPCCASADRASVARSDRMSALHGHLADYLRVRRALGFRLERSGYELGRFVDHLDASGIETITIEVALAWATRSPTRWLLIRCGCERSAASRGTCGRSMFRSRCHQRSAPGPTSAARAVSLYRRGDRPAGAGGRDRCARHTASRRCVR